MFLRKLLFVSALGVSCVLHAATEFPAGLMPVELANHFVGGAISRGLPDGFPVVNLPAGIDLRLAGGMKRGSTLDAVLLTGQGVDNLRAALVAAYTAAGWIDVAVGGNLNYLCHDTQGYLLFMPVAANAGALRVTHTPAYFSPGQGCADVAAGTAVQWQNYFLGLLPRLTPPPEAQPSGNPRANFVAMSYHYTSSSSTVGVEQNSDFTVADVDVASLHESFAEGLREQGWTNDSTGAGEWSASSVWYRTAAPPANAGADITPTELTGILTLLHDGGDSVQVRFTLRATTNAVFVMGSYSAVRDYVERPPVNVPSLGIRGIPAGYQP